jgi:hypothetical protein
MEFAVLTELLAWSDGTLIFRWPFCDTFEKNDFTSATRMVKSGFETIRSEMRQSSPRASKPR